MTDLEKIIFYTLKSFNVAIVVKIGEKLVVLNPQILQEIPLASLAESLSASDLTEEEILKGMEVIDVARSPRVPPK